MRKSLLIGGAIAAIGIVITTIVLSGVIEQEEDLVLSNYPKLFEKDVVIVIGENASLMEYESAEAIVENITENPPRVTLGNETNERQLREWADFKSKYGENWKVSWNDITGTPSMIYGSVYNMDVGEVTKKDKAERLAKNFISDNKDLLKVDDMSNLKLLNVEKGNEEWYVEYQQYYQGIPVFNSRVGLTMSDKGEIKSLGSDFYPNINLTTEPKLSKNDAIKIAKRETRYSTKSKEVILVIFPQEVDDTLMYNFTWIVPLISEHPLWGKKFFVDAIDGKIIHQADIFISAENNMQGNWRSLLSNNKLRIGLIAITSIILLLFLIKRRFLR